MTRSWWNGIFAAAVGLLMASVWTDSWLTYQYTLATPFDAESSFGHKHPMYVNDVQATGLALLEWIDVVALLLVISFAWKGRMTFGNRKTADLNDSERIDLEDFNLVFGCSLLVNLGVIFSVGPWISAFLVSYGIVLDAL